jgi:hypothetical protein
MGSQRSTCYLSYSNARPCQFRTCARTSVLLLLANLLGFIFISIICRLVPKAISLNTLKAWAATKITSADGIFRRSDLWYFWSSLFLLFFLQHCGRVSTPVTMTAEKLYHLQVRSYNNMTYICKERVAGSGKEWLPIGREPKVEVRSSVVQNHGDVFTYQVHFSTRDDVKVLVNMSAAQVGFAALVIYLTMMSLLSTNSRMK